MKTVRRIFGMLIILITVVGCSTVKVTDSWKDIRTSNIKDKNVLVLSKTNDNIARIQFEEDVVERLLKKNIKALESYKMFPNISPEDALSGKQLETVKEELKQLGIDVVVVTIVKDVNEYTKTTTTHSGQMVSIQPTYLSRGYYRNFYRYYEAIYVDTGNSTTVTASHKNYILETLIYDLTETENNQLLSVITTKIENPVSLGSSSEDFSKKLVNKLIK